jgi:hypothetical protein
MLAGDMIYGLIRADALEAAGVFRHVVTPDRQVLLALSLFGGVRYVSEVLWYREMERDFDLERQRKVFFPDGTPVYAYLPSHVQHCASLLWDFGIRGRGGRISGGSRAHRTPPFICGSPWRGSCRASAGKRASIMKILFVMRHSGYVRNFESTLRMLCERGHTGRPRIPDRGHPLAARSVDMTTQMADMYPRFSRSTIPVRDDSWGYAARELRLGLDYLRYLGPAYRNAPKLRARAEREVPDYLLEANEARPRHDEGRPCTAGRRRCEPCCRPFRPMYESMHSSKCIVPTCRAHAAHRAWRAAGRVRAERTRARDSDRLCVASWDNLTNKGLIHGPVDLVTVWNAMMKEEAITLHGVPEEKVVVTGAQPFDHWFGWQPSVAREAFCRQVGLPADRPYILYVCSSRFIAPEEVPFVRSWLQHLRQSGLCAGVLVRPHPQNAEQWRHADLSEYGPAVVWPPAGATPSDGESRATISTRSFIAPPSSGSIRRRRSKARLSAAAS